VPVAFVAIVQATRHSEDVISADLARLVDYGASPRASIAFLSAARALALLAVERARHQRHTATIAVAGVVASLSLSIALTVMVASFRESVTQWLDTVLPADLYARAGATLVAGDVVTVYSQKDIRVPVARQTRLVSLEGEVGAPGVYQLLPGDTLQSVIARAGGFTAQAYVYGLEFSREETRARQRENLAAAITRLESLAAVQAARDVANRRDDPTAAASTAAVSNAATQAQLSRLRGVQPNGRIALELRPDAVALSSLPDVPLEGGDRIVVPPRPGFVTVAGAVVNSNAFLWKPGRTAGEYLRLAGADEAAEPANMFILRADGTVSHAGDNRSFFGRNSLESQVMQPGDALIVPNQLDFETWGRAFVRNLKDFAQIFTGFGIVILLLAASAGAAFWGFSRLSSSEHAVDAIITPKVAMIRIAYAHRFQAVRNPRNFPRPTVAH